MLSIRRTSVSKAAAGSAAVFFAALVAPAAALAAGDPPAAGADTAQVVGATIAAMLLTVSLLFIGIRYRAGHLPILKKFSDFSGAIANMPGWAALPAGFAGGALLLAVFGLYWDVSLHVDNGRDAGPLANPSHYFILAGLFGILTAGWLAVILPPTDSKPGPAAVRIAGGWYAPVSGLTMIGTATIALLGFPLDDFWHRLFGQDVTLWGPTHMMMLCGGALTLISILGILAEGRLAITQGYAEEPKSLRGITKLAPSVLTPERARALRMTSAAGGLLIGLTIFQGEFDYGIPQYRLLFDPVLIAGAAAIALTAARIIGGKGAALWAVGLFLVVRGGLTLLVGPVLGETTAHFPLYIVEGLVVEGVALWLGTRRAYRFAAVSAVLIATVGLLSQWAWSQVWMPFAWPAHILPEAIALSLIVAVAGSVIGVYLGGALRMRTDLAGSGRSRVGLLAGVLAIAAVFAYLGQTTVPNGARAIVTTTDAVSGKDRRVNATVRFSPAGVVDDADWLVGFAWQGKTKLIAEPMKRNADGSYSTTKPLPVFGSWKSGIRFHRGSEMAVLPLRMPADSAIPVGGIAAPAKFERALVADHQLLQRERKSDTPLWLWGVGSSIVLALIMLLLVLLAWGLARIARAGDTSATADAPARESHDLPANTTVAIG